MLAFALISLPASAGLDCTVKSTQLERGHANTYIVGQIHPIADKVGSVQIVRIIYRCQVSGTPTQWGIASRSVPTTYATGLVAHPNDTSNHPVMTTAQLEQYGLGFAGYFYPAGQWPGSIAYQNMDHPAAVVWQALPAADGDGYVELDVMAMYYFVKINDNLDALLDEIPRTVQATPFPLVAVTIQADDSAVFSPTAQVMAHMPTLTVAQRTCTTPFVNTVKLPPVNAADLTVVGASGPPTDFWIEVRCPHGLAMFAYYVEPAHGFENEAQGVIKINPASDAKGIGLQITTRSKPSTGYLVTGPGLNPTYQPLTFGATVRYAAYGFHHTIRPNTDPLNATRIYRINDAVIPLRAAVYRTGTVVPGTYNAAIFIHLVYR